MEIYPNFNQAAHAMSNEGVRVGNTCFIDNKAYISEEVECIDINTAEEGTVIKFYGTHFSACYTLLVIKNNDNETRVWAWKDTDAPNLDCSLRNIVSYKRKDDEMFRIEQGILRKGDRFAMPYFKYKFEDDKKETIHPNQTREFMWLDTYIKIEILRLPKP